MAEQLLALARGRLPILPHQTAVCRVIRLITVQDMQDGCSLGLMCSQDALDGFRSSGFPMAAVRPRPHHDSLQARRLLSTLREGPCWPPGIKHALNLIKGHWRFRTRSGRSSAARLSSDNLRHGQHEHAGTKPWSPKLPALSALAAAAKQYRMPCWAPSTSTTTQHTIGLYPAGLCNADLGLSLS